jgi:hypothetical protein
VYTLKRGNMEDVNGLTDEDIRELILEQLDEAGIAPGAVGIRVLKGSRVVVEGNVDSEMMRKIIIQTIQNATGIDNIVDEMIVADDEYESFDEGPRHEDYELYDEDNEYVGSEDMFRAVEDGVPYIPPTEPPSSESSEAFQRKKKRKGKYGR